MVLQPHLITNIMNRMRHRACKRLLAGKPYSVAAVPQVKQPPHNAITEGQQQESSSSWKRKASSMMTSHAHIPPRHHHIPSKIRRCPFLELRSMRRETTRPYTVFYTGRSSSEDMEAENENPQQGEKLDAVQPTKAIKFPLPLLSNVAKQIAVMQAMEEERKERAMAEELAAHQKVIDDEKLCARLDKQAGDELRAAKDHIYEEAIFAKTTPKYERYEEDE